MSHYASDLEALFNQAFLTSHNTRLVGGGDEPLYQPSVCLNRSQDSAEIRRQLKLGRPDAREYLNATESHIYYREDFFASALHEVAHWCIAGEQRRKLIDYGYWYEPDGRSPSKQADFQIAECKPQALEWIFSIICRSDFSVSIDNLQSIEAPHNAAPFVTMVQQTVLEYCANGLPLRAQVFAIALQDFYRSDCMFELAVEVPKAMS
jgi:elongation factor P hydroxylase